MRSLKDRREGDTRERPLQALELKLRIINQLKIELCFGGPLATKPSVINPICSLRALRGTTGLQRKQRKQIYTRRKCKQNV